MGESPARSVLIDAFPRSALRHRDRDAVVCVDVMLATTTLVSAAADGRRAFAAASPEEAQRLAARLGSAVLAGEPSAGAACPDSPSDLARRPEDRRPLVLFSPPGTELLGNADGSASVLVACFRNLNATAAWIARAAWRVAILAAGCRQEFSCEDQMAAAWIADALLGQGFEVEDRRTADLVRRWRGIEPSLAALGNSAAQLRREGRGADVDFVLSHVDDVPLACVLSDSEVHPREATFPAPLPLAPPTQGVPREH